MMHLMTETYCIWLGVKYSLYDPCQANLVLEEGKSIKLCKGVHNTIKISYFTPHGIDEIYGSGGPCYHEPFLGPEPMHEGENVEPGGAPGGNLGGTWGHLGTPGHPLIKIYIKLGQFHQLGGGLLPCRPCRIAD